MLKGRVFPEPHGQDRAIAPAAAKEFLHRFAEARRISDELFGLIRPEFLYERAVAQRHRLVFYLGHLDGFDWNQVGRFHLGLSELHPSFDRLFEAGIDPEPGALPSDQPSDWPRVEEIRSYCREARNRVDHLVAAASPEVLHIALEHRLMHVETLAYLIHNMPYEQRAPLADLADMPESYPPAFTRCEIPAGIATLGKDRQKGFGWDNEFEKHLVRVPGFVIDQNKVTNYDYLQFVKAGAKPPHFWKRLNGRWFYRGMAGLTPLPLYAPVYVNHCEASDYAEWKGLALPTEAQIHRAAFGSRTGIERRYPWGEMQPTPSVHGNFDFERWDPVPVNATPGGDSGYGVAQLAGNGWEWTCTPFEPFPGFHPSPTYPGYSADFFDGAHFVLKGASPRTASCFLRRSFRNWFRPDYPYVYASFRCVEN
ncbi:MAG TPA: SUMF1/EgtB/PvdO family nonheme iron enzyme [Bryobacteraceae bacterium]|nr:SUMF1/EgtB/PvdO family nonheme iron enzyme [Bryobacteraceae bacterium]